jgi:hypothetical protein
MNMPGDFPTGLGFNGFQQMLDDRLRNLAQQREGDAQKNFDFVMPIGLFFVIDQENGGGVTGDELVRRFHLLHHESKHAIDFYFLGWHWRDVNDPSKGIVFNLKSFANCREAFKQLGIKTFGGSADLILVDARYHSRVGPKDGLGRDRPRGYQDIDLNFPEAVQINLATGREKNEIPPLGEFLQSIVAVAESLHERGDSSHPVYSISDSLGLATAKRSFLDFILKKWGAVIGADKLASLAVRNLGPVVTLFGYDTHKHHLLPEELLALSVPRRDSSVKLLH